MALGKRWHVEVFHKFLKFNANLDKSSTKLVRTQSNHVFMAIYATFKHKCLSITDGLNPFAFCRQLLIDASRIAYNQLLLFSAAALHQLPKWGNPGPANSCLK